MELMALLYDMLPKARKEGLMSIEKRHRGRRTRAPLFSKYPTVAARPSRHRVHHRLPAPDGRRQPERVRDREPDGQRDRDPPPRRRGARRRRSPRVGDALPAFGIVAAVMGVVHTMELGRPAAGRCSACMIAHGAGRHVPRHPAGVRLRRAARRRCSSRSVDERPRMLAVHQGRRCSRACNGYAPPVAVEFGRKVLYSTERPTLRRARRPRRRARPSKPRAASNEQRDEPADSTKAAADHRQARSRRAAAAITAAPGRSPTPTS